jgi:hypothetical protein
VPIIQKIREGGRKFSLFVLTVKDHVIQPSVETLSGRLERAMDGGDTALALDALQKGAKADGGGFLFAAARDGNVPLMQELLKKGADVNQTRVFGQGTEYSGITPLADAVNGGQAAAVDFLLKHGASMHIPVRSRMRYSVAGYSDYSAGTSVLDIARRKELHDIVLLLEEAAKTQASPAAAVPAIIPEFNAAAAIITSKPVVIDHPLRLKKAGRSPAILR